MRIQDAMREIKITKGFIKSTSSVLVEFGNTRVICTAMTEAKTPPFLAGTGSGWVKAEYAMLPGSTNTRKQRSRNYVDGRSTEIQRLIGRSLRCVVDLLALKEHTIWLDCDVIEADGGTRTASITGAFISLVIEVDRLIKEGTLEKSPILDYVAAVSCGIVNGEPLLDLCYLEDSGADVDMNFVMTGGNMFIEVQGTGEKRAFSKQEMDTLYELASEGIKKLVEIQKETLGELCALVGDTV